MTDAAADTSKITVNEVPDPPSQSTASSAKILHGRLVPPQQQILLYSAAEWEEFILEWAHYQKTKYKKVVRLSGANDMGIDVAGFTDDKGFFGVWDNHQCKHYDDPLTPSTALPEIGKALWHGFNGKFALPRRYYFMAPQDCGMSLKKLLLNSAELKNKLIEKWDDWCADAITSTEVIPLTGEFAKFVQSADFWSFTFKTALEAIDEHRHTPYHAARFGGGLPDRPQATTPPTHPAQMESRYLQQLFESYGDHHHAPVSCLTDLNAWQDLVEHYHRQREYFYHAEIAPKLRPRHGTSGDIRGAAKRSACRRCRDRGRRAPRRARSSERSYSGSRAPAADGERPD